ncbi:hypothetical protein LCGC14_1187810 [marine sediment metagenome]|uniref:Uncharacterized protein n=1 Tax=marine sediment metagenome TaxID=412755 RepID=A0A0F9LQ48_9ZZZZ
MAEMTLTHIKLELGHRAPVFAARIAPLYRLLGWTWGRDLQIPTESQILEQLRELIDHIDSLTSMHGTGGLEAYCDEEDCSLGLRVVIDDMAVPFEETESEAGR